MSCMCGDTECPSCGVAQGTLDVPFYLSQRELESYRAADERDYRRMLREERISDTARKIRKAYAPHWCAWDFVARNDTHAFGEGRV